VAKNIFQDTDDFTGNIKEQNNYAPAGCTTIRQGQTSRKAGELSGMILE
jgi:hypothetical protein